jgi:diaminopimelate decarboxylase
MEIAKNKLCFEGISADSLVEKFGSPLYVYEEKKIRAQCRNLYDSIDYHPKLLLYACKANENPSLMKIIKEEGFGIDAVSPGEVQLAKEKVKVDTGKILYTGNNTTDDEMKWLVKNGIMINMDSLSQLRRYGALDAPGKEHEIIVRINPDVGAGHHEHCITGGPDSKFGIYYDRTDEIKRIAGRYGLKIKGLHQHIGSGILDVDIFKKAMNVLFKTAKEFDDLNWLDFGGGIGVPYSPDQKPIDIEKFGKEVSDMFSGFCKEYGKNLWLVLEPGRYLVAESGTLLTRVNTLKQTPAHTFAGTDSGFNHLIRHTLYKSYHGIMNADKSHGKKQNYAVAGNICESGDLFSHGRDISTILEGDVLAIFNAGAYGFSMSSNYNLRPRPAEVLIKENGSSKLIRSRDTFEDMIRHTEFE